ncbi:MAG: fumarate hydratase [Deltaproteobacteria bacterium]|jgi:fumarate hydratase subunit alpha|nr:fumarate hydratase [Deltaproteobacteria bacterium]
MREILTPQIRDALFNLCVDTATRLPERVRADLKESERREPSPQGRGVLNLLLENERLARDQKIPLCQDAGLPQVILEIGQEVRLTGPPLKEEVEAGVREAYAKAFLRQSGCHPLNRANLRAEIPVSLETLIVPGDKVMVYTLAKGGGCDNRSSLFNLPPTAELPLILEKVTETVINAGPDACPPFYLGVNIGGTFESAPRYARRALLDIVWGPPPQGEEAELAERVLETLNASGIGPMSVGGRATALGVRVTLRPTHIASLPVAVNLCCHSFRPGRGEL